MSSPAHDLATPMTADQRAEFERDGFVVIPGVLTQAEVDFYAQALDRVYRVQQAAGAVAPGGPMHLHSAVANCPEAAGLIDHPQVFGLVWSVLGWNIHICHSHLDVHPPIAARQQFRYEWHQHGGRQNREIETSPRPRLSVKLAYWLSDVSRPGRGDFKVWPGSHTRNRIDGPPRRDIAWPDPQDVIELRKPRRCGVFRPEAAARPVGQLLTPHPQGDVLRLHLPVDHHPRPDAGPPLQPRHSLSSARYAGSSWA